jgi:predicted dehydrogenase
VLAVNCAPMRALLVGAGGMGKTWAKILDQSKQADLAGWIDIREGAAQAGAQEIGIQSDYYGTNLEQAIRDVGPDFVVDVTIPEAHHEVTLTALRMGVPVLGEKPMAATMQQAKEMVRASEEAGKLYMVSQSRRYNGSLQGYRDLIRNQLGRLGILDADFYIGAHFGGFRDEMSSPLVLDMAIHTFDKARMISGKDPVSVYAEEFNPSWSWYKGDACAVCLFEMTDGVRFTYRGSWCAEGCQTSWEGEWRAVGEHGTAKWDGADGLYADIVSEPGGFMSKTVRAVGQKRDIPYGIEGSLYDFLNALRTGEEPMGECHDNIKSLAMVFAAIESSRLGRRVDIGELL